LKNHIYSERGAHGASSYAKNSISIFFEKSAFLRGGGLPLTETFFFNILDALKGYNLVRSALNSAK